MRMKPRLIALGLLMAATLFGTTPSSAATLTLGALGPATLTGFGSCTSSTVGIDFSLNTPDFLLQLGFFPAAGPAAANPDCAFLVEYWNQFGNRFPPASTPCGLPYEYAMKPDSLTVSGNVYTVANSFRQCTGVIHTQNIKLTVSAASVVFSLKYTWSSGHTFTTNGTLMRIW